MRTPKAYRFEGSHEEAVATARKESSRSAGDGWYWSAEHWSLGGFPTAAQAQDVDKNGFGWNLVPRRLEGDLWLGPSAFRLHRRRKYMMGSVVVVGFLFVAFLLVGITEILDPVRGKNTVVEGDPNGATVILAALALIGMYLAWEGGKPVTAEHGAIPDDHYRTHVAAYWTGRDRRDPGRVA